MLYCPKKLKMDKKALEKKVIRVQQTMAIELQRLYKILKGPKFLLNSFLRSADSKILAKLDCLGWDIFGRNKYYNVRNAILPRFGAYLGVNAFRFLGIQPREYRSIFRYRRKASDYKLKKYFDKWVGSIHPIKGCWITFFKGIRSLTTRFLGYDLIVRKSKKKRRVNIVYNLINIFVIGKNLISVLEMVIIISFHCVI